MKITHRGKLDPNVYFMLREVKAARAICVTEMAGNLILFELFV